MAEIDARPGFGYKHATTRGVAQTGSALGSGPSGRRFKSSRPDHARRERRGAGHLTYASFTPRILSEAEGSARLIRR
jgi:hypothetical protein